MTDDIPASPAVYLRDVGYREDVIHFVRSLGWPEPAVYADADEPSNELAALIEAISAGRHDAVFAAHPAQIGTDLAQVEAFDRLCRQHGTQLHFQWAGGPRDTHALFEVIEHVRQFTVTDEHLRLLRRACVSWQAEAFGAPEIDPKRPYGNSNVFADIAEILEVPEDEVNPDGEWTDLNPDIEWRFTRLHVETAIVLRIGLATGEFRTGRYARETSWNSTWKRDET